MNDNTEPANYCSLCGTRTWAWQKEEFNIVGSLCPECSLEFADAFPGEDFEELDMLAGML